MKDMTFRNDLSAAVITGAMALEGCVEKKAEVPEIPRIEIQLPENKPDTDPKVFFAAPPEDLNLEIGTFRTLAEFNELISICQTTLEGVLIAHTLHSNMPVEKTCLTINAVAAARKNLIEACTPASEAEVFFPGAEEVRRKIQDVIQESEQKIDGLKMVHPECFTSGGKR